MTDIQPLSEAEEAELRKVVEGMTPEPWRTYGTDDEISLGPGFENEHIDCGPNAVGIAALRNAATRLLATIAELRDMLLGQPFAVDRISEHELTLAARLDDANATIANLRTVAEVAKDAVDAFDCASVKGDCHVWIDRLSAALAKANSTSGAER